MKKFEILQITDGEEVWFELRELKNFWFINYKVSVRDYIPGFLKEKGGFLIKRFNRVDDAITYINQHNHNDESTTKVLPIDNYYNNKIKLSNNE